MAKYVYYKLQTSWKKLKGKACTQSKIVSLKLIFLNVERSSVGSDNHLVLGAFLVYLFVVFSRCIS